MIAIVSQQMTKPGPKMANLMVAELLALFPNLNTKDSDVRMRLAKLSLVFEAYSGTAATHVLDPVNGIAAKCEFLSFKALNDELQAFDSRQQQVIAAAMWALREHERRELEATMAGQIEQDRATYVERHGMTPVDRVKELMNQTAKGEPDK